MRRPAAGAASADSVLENCSGATVDENHSLVPKSPRWTTPAEVMRARQLRLSRKRNTAVDCQKPKTLDRNEADCETVVGSPPPPALSRRVNPFGSLLSSARRRLMSGAGCKEAECVMTNDNNKSTASCSDAVSSQSSSQPSALLRGLDRLTDASVGTALEDESVSQDASASQPDFLVTAKPNQAAAYKAYSPFSTSCETTFRECGRTAPTDWSPKLRIRLISPVPFACCAVLPRSQEKSSAIVSAASGTRSFDSSDDLCQSPASKLQRALLYWCYPCVPGCDLSAWTSQPNKPSAATSLHKNVKSALRDVWSSSFESAYDLVKSVAMPYFYMVAHSFTVLVRTGDVSGCTVSTSELTAILTPTTVGLRQALRAADVPYTMAREQLMRAEGGTAQQEFTNGLQLGSLSEPVSSGEDCKAIGPSLADDVTTKQVEDDDPDADDCSSYDRWLESLGVSKDSLPGLEGSIMRQRFRETQSNVDGRPGSTIWVRGASGVHSLFNFLLNYGGCVAATGPLAGLPPAIVAPAPFLHSTMQPLKYKHIKLHRQEGTLVSHPGSSATSLPFEAAAVPSKQRRRQQHRPHELQADSESWMLDIDGGPVLPTAVAQLLQLAELQGRCYVRLGSPTATTVGSGRSWDALNACCAPSPVDSQSAAARAVSTHQQASGGTAKAASGGRLLKELSYCSGEWHWS